MREFKYLVIRRDPHVDVLYYCGDGAWSPLRSAALACDGAQASVLCENLSAKDGKPTMFVKA